MGKRFFIEAAEMLLNRVAIALVWVGLNASQVVAEHPWPTAGKAPSKAPPMDYPHKPTGWRVQNNQDQTEREWRDATGMFAIVSREYEIPLDHKFLQSAQFQKLPVEIQNRLFEPLLLYRAYFIGNGKYFEIPTPLAYTFDGAAGHVEMWYKGDKLDMLDGVAATGDKYHKKSGDLSGLLPPKPKEKRNRAD
ncbi:MAG TPA: hypothetical protein VL175_17610 [Pirellulales bacterium]|nr:hypothetical protein [Pirellulales bacterium]